MADIDSDTAEKTARTLLDARVETIHARDNVTAAERADTVAWANCQRAGWTVGAVTHYLADGATTTPWGIIGVNRTLDPGQTVSLLSQHSHRPRVTGPRHEEFDLDVRDTAGRTWHRQRDGHIQLTEGTT